MSRCQWGGSASRRESSRNGRRGAADTSTVCAKSSVGRNARVSAKSPLASLRITLFWASLATGRRYACFLGSTKQPDRRCGGYPDLQTGRPPTGDVLNNPIHPRFRLEQVGIRVAERPHGGTNTSLGGLSSSVVDCYTNAHVGSVVHGRKDDGQMGYIAQSVFGGKLPEPDGGWGPRFDLAAIAVWSYYSRSLPWRERLRRCLWRWAAVAWLLAGIILGLFANVLAQALPPM